MVVTGSGPSSPMSPCHLPFSTGFTQPFVSAKSGPSLSSTRSMHAWTDLRIHLFEHLSTHVRIVSWSFKGRTVSVSDRMNGNIHTEDMEIICCQKIPCQISNIWFTYSDK